MSIMNTDYQLQKTIIQLILAMIHVICKKYQISRLAMSFICKHLTLKKKKNASQNEFQTSVFLLK